MQNYRNFSIIAHIDHGKSTLADRILELTNGGSSVDDRTLDTLDLEQERGITIKLQPCTMSWKDHHFNLIDTPGHVDFSYEVSRSLAACEGAILLVDATQGIQAQTLSNTQKATELGLKIIPVLNKVDLAAAEPEKRALELADFLNIDPEEVLQVSGKTGLGVPELLDQIIERIPAPEGSVEKPLKALIFDSFYDEHKGIVIAIRIIDGEIELKKTKQLHLIRKEDSFSPTEIGVFTPGMKKLPKLSAGEVGYIATGVKDIKAFTVGDTVSDSKETEPLDGYQVPQPNVFASFFPTDPDKYEELRTGLAKISMNDGALTYSDQKSQILGSGFRCGFLGLLHMEILQERLEREYDIGLIITAPNVEYQATLVNGEEISMKTPKDMPDRELIAEIREPWVRIEIFTPQQYMGQVMDLCTEKRGQYANTRYLNNSVNMQFMIIEFDLPMGSLVSSFFDQLKNRTSGYASMEYEFIDYFPGDIVKVTILVNKEEVPTMSFMEHRDNARAKATKMLEVMKDEIPRQQFQLPLQAAIGSKIIAREDIRAVRKDVTAKLYGGDYSRKKKLLEKQKKGKKRLRSVGQVTIPQEAFLAILKT